MTHLFNIPIEKFGVPFNKLWKRVLLHFGIALAFGTIWLPTYNYDLVIYVKFVLMIFINDIIQSFGHVVVFYKLEQRYDWINETKKRIIYSILLHLVATYASYFTVIPLYIHFVFGAPFRGAYDALLNIWALPLILTVFSLFLAIASDFFRNWKKSFAAAEQLHAQMMNYKYESLRNQINPHFLLDSFSVLKKFVYSDPSKAVEFIHKISNLYRNVLDVKDKEFVSLKEELNFMSVYLDLLKLRYGSQLEIIIDVKAEADDVIIPLSLQSLLEYAVENTIQHVNGNPSIIKLFKSNDHIEISGEKDLSDAKVHLDNSAIKTIEQQYQFYSKRPVMFMATPTTFSVRIPVLKQVI